ncbi:hypothetical protein EDC14_1001166 [Hydrogenispora ethanolica]|uniref:Uncharacterized protein n=1 Tax=Hydrogenispora ethanolica TaxID=1082276 RepID=A0A4R1SBK3_HYDET|nr:hypothetical protein [Hydrogenispora ethanolica]TCL76881.1 hypothetical protein EDC14_1001166 [Hydrogenispora ethanolica]
MLKWLWKPVDDRFLRGLIAGLIAGFIKDIPDFLPRKWFHVKQLDFWDYLGEMALGGMPRNFGGEMVAFLIELGFSIGLGAVFTCIVAPLFPTRHHLVRGVFYGGSCWFILISIIKLYRITELMPKNPITPLSTLAMSVCYGWLVAFIDHRLNSRTESLS